MAETAIAGTLVGCVGCMVQIESLSKACPGSVNLMTFATFLFVSLVGFIRQSRLFTVLPVNRVPLKKYLFIVVLFFFVNIGNNLSLNLDVSVPLFIIFRSGTLVVNLLLGRLLKNRFYSNAQILSVIFVTMGIVIFTLADKDSRSAVPSRDRSAFVAQLPFPPLLLGVALLTVALFTSSYLGFCQEDLYRCHGKHPEEAMFFVHSLSLPGFVLLHKDIFAAATRLTESEYFSETIPIPRLWVVLASICCLQWLCITQVYKLTSLTTSFNVTMVVTLRKFLSLALSILLFGNPFNNYHLLGAALVLIGTLSFTEFWGTNVWRKTFQKKKFD